MQLESLTKAEAAPRRPRYVPQSPSIFKASWLINEDDDLKEAQELRAEEDDLIQSIRQLISQR